MKQTLRDFLCPQPKSKIKAGDGQLKGAYNFYTSSQIQSKFYHSATYTQPALIFGTGGMASVHYCNEPFSTSTDCLVMYGRLGAPLELIYYYLRSNMHLLQDGFKGAGLQHISKDYILNININMPAPSLQEQITHQMRLIDAMINGKKQQILSFDEAVKSRFIELFGVYPSNPKGWETATIRDIVADVRYGSSRPAVDGGKYPYLRMNNITYGGELDLTDTKRIDIPDNELDKCTVRRGDVLFNRTNSKELVGKTCVYNRDEMMVLAGFVIRVRVTERVLPEFLSAFLNTDFSKQMLLGMCKAAIGQANINAQEMQNIGIYLPPTEVQRQFVQFKEQTDKSKLAVQKGLQELEILKKSLMQQYFG